MFLNELIIQIVAGKRVTKLKLSLEKRLKLTSFCETLASDRSFIDYY